MRIVSYFIFLIFIPAIGLSQVCTANFAGASINWSSAASIPCSEGGDLSTYSILRIPAGKTIVFNNVTDTWTGTNIEVFGTLRSTADVTINTNITIKSGGLVAANGAGDRIRLGSVSGCGYSITIETGGLLDVGNASTRIFVCGQEIIRGLPGAGGCNTCPEVPPSSGNYDCTGVPLPYCEVPGGFRGPLYFEEDGVQPIDLLSFEALINKNSIELDWITSREENFSHFILEHSVNGSSFTALAEIEGAGYNTESLIEYSYTHRLPKLGVNYYRLKAVDLDGTYEYFGPISVRFNGEEQLWISPNPSAGDKVVYQTNFTPNENDRVLVYNQLGSVVADEPAIKNNGTVYFSESLKAGAYILKYSTGQQVLFARFIVVK
jgi:hypothetical protein